MEDIEIINLWKSYDRKLEEHLVFNRQHAEDITKIKTRSLLASMTPLKIFTVVCGILWVGFIDTLIFNLFHVASSFFLVSAVILTLLNKLAIGIYLYQLILIQQVDINEPVLVAQEKLSRLKSSTIWVARILFLQLPVWTTFYWNESMLRNGNIWLYAIQIMVTTGFTYLAVWLFFNIRYENRDKKWFRLIFNAKEWYPVIKSMELLNQIDQYREENN